MTEPSATTPTPTPTHVPEIVFILPYRNRPQQKMFCIQHLTSILATPSVAETSKGKIWNYEIVLSHQCDIRSFNRGAMKDIGFLAVKKKYPDHYRNIIFVFNDLDTVPYANILDYFTPLGTVKHYYGFHYALGGILAIRGADFETLNGFPCFWGWGMEDNTLQTRCERKGITIDRTQFYPIGNPNILHLFDGVNRIINKKDPWRAKHDDGIDGLCTIHKLEYEWNTLSTNENDNEPAFCDLVLRAASRIQYINIKTFLTRIRFESDHYFKYDLREPLRKVLNPNRVPSPKSQLHIDDWSQFPFYPTTKQYQEWVHTYGKEGADQIVEHNQQHSTDPTRPILPPSIASNHAQPRAPASAQPSRQPQQPNNIQYAPNARAHHTYLQSAVPPPPPSLNKYDPRYASAAGVKPRATASARIRLGGVY